MRCTRIALLWLLATLAGCSSAPYRGNENSPYYLVPGGSHVILNRELVVPPDAVGVYIQEGRILTMTEVRFLNPYCKFELSTRHDAIQNVAPDDITITHTLQDIRYDATGGAEPRHYAQLAATVLADMSGDGSTPSVQLFLTRMDLRSVKQPNIFRLTCAQQGYPGIDRHVTIAEIRRALGSIFTLQLQ